MKKLIGMSFLVASASLYAADPVTLNITGNIVATPCQVSSDSVTIGADLGQNIQASDMQTAGAAAGWKPINIKLVSCPAGTSSVIMTMHGTADPVQPADLYLNNGAAQNVSVQLQSTGGTVLGDGKTITGNISSGAYTFPLQARAYTKNGGATPGTIAATVTASFVYN